MLRNFLPKFLIPRVFPVYFSTSLAYSSNENSILFRRQKRKPDRFGITKCSDITRLLHLFQTSKFTLTLNENILICHQISTLAPVKLLKTIYGLSEILPKIHKEIGDMSLLDEDPLVGSLLWSMKTLNCYKNLNEWVHLLDLIMADCFEPECEEVLRAIQGLDSLENYFQEDWQKDLFRCAFLKIETLLVEHLKLMRYNLENLRNICEILVKNGRNAEEVFEEIDFQVMKIVNSGESASEDAGNRGKRFALEDAISFAYFFAKAGYFSENFSSFVNEFLKKEIENGEKTLVLQGKELANLMFCWHFRKNKQISFDLDENVKKWVFSSSFGAEMRYSVEDLIAIHNGLYLLDNISRKQMNSLQKHLENKLLEIDKMSISQLNLDLIAKYFELRAKSEYNDDFNSISSEVFTFFDVLCSQIYERFHHVSVHEFFLMLETRNILNKFPHFFSVLPKFIEIHSFQYDFDDVCYFYLLFVSNASLLREEKSGEFYNALNNIKEFIKFVALRRGFKMDMDSNFHKLLSAIDLAHFFEGGEG